MFTRSKRGFSTIELLTVIAIIAILAAIVYPIMFSARERAKQTRCMGNLMRISQAVLVYHSEQHKYPEFIVSPVMKLKTGSTTETEPYDGIGTPIGMDQTSGVVDGQLVSLYPEYLKEPSVVACAEAAAAGKKSMSLTDGSPQHISQDPLFEYYCTVSAVTFDTSTHVATVTVLADGTSGNAKWDSFAAGSMRARGVEDPSNPYNEGDPDKKLMGYWLYNASAYELQSPQLPPNSPLLGPDEDSVDEAHYARCWWYYPAQAGDDPNIPSNYQLRWQSPSADNTVITWCAYHRKFNRDGFTRASVDLVLFLDGHAVRKPSTQMEDWRLGWRAKATNE